MLKAQNPFVFSENQEKILLQSCYNSCFVITKDKRILIAKDSKVIEGMVDLFLIDNRYISNDISQLLYIYPN